MAFDGIITAAVVNELSQQLVGGKIEKIYQPESDELIFHIHSRAGNRKLYASCASSHARLHLIQESPVNPEMPAAFCMLLRKHLSGGRISEIVQKDSERIVEITVDTINELGFSTVKKLIIEIMGKHSNIILTDNTSGKIIDSVKRVSIDTSRVRQILPGKEYEYPPTQDKIPLAALTPDTVERLCSYSKDPELLQKSLLSGIQGISPQIAARLSALACKSEHVSEETCKAVYRELIAMRECLKTGAFSPVIYLDANGAPVDFHIFPLPLLEDSCSTLEFSDIHDCITSFYKSKIGANRAKQKAVDLARAVKSSLDKLYLKKQRISEDLLKAEGSDSYRLYGELLTANLHLFKTGDKEAKVTSYYDGKEVVIPLDKRLTPAKNAQQYFKKYGKAKTALKEKAVQLHETNADIAYLESVDAFIENASSAEETEALRNELIESGYLRKRKSQAKPVKIKSAPWEYKTESGLRVLAGRNNKENDILTFKTAERTDLWFHTKDIPGSHVILFTRGLPPSEKDILEAAAIAAYHSKGQDSENVPVDYVLVKHVKKPGGARPGMVIFTNNKTVYVNPKRP